MSTGDGEDNKVFSRARRRLRRAVLRLKRRMWREAEHCAIMGVHEVVGRGIDWFETNSGRLFLLDPDKKKALLHSVPRSAIRSTCRKLTIPSNDTTSVIATVSESREEYFSNDLKRDEGDGKPYCHFEPNARSVLAAPVYLPDGNRTSVVGVLSFEADSPGRFTPVRARELYRNGNLLGEHLPILRDMLAVKPIGERLSPEMFLHIERPDLWFWHPEIHGWRLGKLLSRICEQISRSLRVGDSEPACSIWYCDPNNNESWTLANYGYDYCHRNLNTLSERSAVCRVAQNATRLIQRGTPETLRFEQCERAVKLGVKQALMATLQSNVKNHPDSENVAEFAREEPFRGVLLLYGFQDQAAFPGDKTIQWLVKQIEGLISSFYCQRNNLAKAYIRSRLTTSGTANPSFRLFRRALMAVLPSDALAIYSTSLDDNKTLDRVDSVGFQREMTRQRSEKSDQGDFGIAKLPISLNGNPISISEYCVRNSGEALRINEGAEEIQKLNQSRPESKKIPLPHPESSERLDAEESHHKRRLGIGVGSRAKDPDALALGVIRLYRSGRNVPFTHPDALLLQDIASSYECCTSIFEDWRYRQRNFDVGPHVTMPAPLLLESVLRRAVDDLEDLGCQPVQGHVLEVCDDAVPPLKRIGYFSLNRRLPQGEKFAEVEEAVREHPGGLIASIPRTPENGHVGERVCIPVMTWSGRQLVRAIICMDFENRVAWRPNMRDRMLRMSIEAASMLAANRWRDPPESAASSEELLTKFLDYVKGLSVGPDADEERRFCFESVAFRRNCDKQNEVGTWQVFPKIGANDDFHRFGVRLSPRYDMLSVPLYFGPFLAAFIECNLSVAAAKSLKKVARAVIERDAKLERQRDAAIATKVGETATTSKTAKGKGLLPSERGRPLYWLESLMGMMQGAWCRIVAPNRLLWKIQWNESGCDSSGNCQWGHSIVYDPPPKTND